eukprot:m.26132 g.26132  ORF g.26132 m.26132 type:complete len:995 (+) comp4245_c0_seq1:43-3027(+)
MDLSAREDQFLQDLIRRLPQASSKGGDEDSLLEAFAARYQAERDFSRSPLFREFLRTLLQHQMSSSETMARKPVVSLLREFTCIRILLREPALRSALFEGDAIPILARVLQDLAQFYLSDAEEYLPEAISELVSVCHKLSSERDARQRLLDCEMHVPLVSLLRAVDTDIVAYSLEALSVLARSPQGASLLCNLDTTDAVLYIIQEYLDVPVVAAAAQLLRSLCESQAACQQLKEQSGLQVVLGRLAMHQYDVALQLVIVMRHMARTYGDDIRALGGIPLLLSFLAGIEGSRPASGQHPVSEEQKILLHAEVCGAITHLAHLDLNALQICDNNGIYLISSLLLPRDHVSAAMEPSLHKLHIQAFRALRFLFALPQNRRPFKRLFPPDLFEVFLRAKHYNYDITAYEPACDALAAMSPLDMAALRRAVAACDAHAEPARQVRDYDLLEKLGEGAFGAVYRARRHHSNEMCAIKELMVSGNAEETKANMMSIEHEMNIALCRMKHTNVVEYYKYFRDGDRVFIVMQLIEGASLGDHLNALIDKGKTMEEARVWNIFIQMCEALRYIHKVVHVVHRDITPNNVMVSWGNQVKLADFGLSRKFTSAELLQSRVGTLMYSCPELASDRGYTEKADVWAAGCVLYQMAALQPPFQCTNALSLVKRIMVRDMAPVPDAYSPLLAKTIDACMCIDPDARPDILGVCSLISDQIMQRLDTLQERTIRLDRQFQRMPRSRGIESRQANFLGASLGSDASALVSPARTGSGRPRWNSSGSGDEDDELKKASPMSARLLTPTSAFAEASGDDTPGNIADLPDISAERHTLRRSISTPIKPLQARPNSRGSTATTPPSRPQTAMGSSGHLRVRSARLNSGTSVTLPSHKLRPIEDPNQAILSMLHRIVSISQRPAERPPNERRTSIDAFKRSLFAGPPTELKGEIRKILLGSSATVMCLGRTGPRPLRIHAASVQDVVDLRATTEEPFSAMRDVTYAMLRAFITSMTD